MSRAPKIHKLCFTQTFKTCYLGDWSNQVKKKESQEKNIIVLQKVYEQKFNYDISQHKIKIEPFLHFAVVTNLQFTSDLVLLFVLISLAADWFYVQSIEFNQLEFISKQFIAAVISWL